MWDADIPAKMPITTNKTAKSINKKTEMIV
jgi:hypothetical protein